MTFYDVLVQFLCPVENRQIWLQGEIFPFFTRHFLLFFSSDLYTIWYVSCIHKYAWTFFMFFFSIYNFFDTILVFQILRLKQIATLSVKHDSLSFCSFDFYKIWYAPYSHQYAWTMLSVFQCFSTKFSIFEIRFYSYYLDKISLCCQNMLHFRRECPFRFCIFYNRKSFQTLNLS